MGEVGNRLVLVGMSRLFTEIAGSTLSLHGWSTLDSQQARLNPSGDRDIVVLACPCAASEVIARIRQARADFPSGKIVLLGVEADDADLVRFIAEGALAFVSGNDGLAGLISALEMVRKKQTLCPGGIAQLVVGTIHKLSREGTLGIESPLTRREKEVLLLIDKGLSNKEIAARLQITPNTVKNHVHHLLEKLKVRSRHHAAWKQTRRPLRAAPLASRARSGTNG
jgi:two-component system, NarL family, nitrate/nitrite response regulator NarL